MADYNGFEKRVVKDIDGEIVELTIHFVGLENITNFVRGLKVCLL